MSDDRVELVANVLWSRLDLNGYTLDGVRRAAEAVISTLDPSIESLQAEVEQTENAIIDAIDAQFDIHALEPEDWAEMSCAIRRAIQALAAKEQTRDR